MARASTLAAFGEPHPYPTPRLLASLVLLAGSQSRVTSGAFLPPPPPPPFGGAKLEALC